MAIYYDEINDQPKVDHSGIIGQYLDFAILGNQGSVNNLINVVTGEDVAFTDQDTQGNALVFNTNDGSVSQSMNPTIANNAVATGMMSANLPTRMNNKDLLPTSDFLLVVDLNCSGSNGKTGHLFKTINGSGGDTTTVFIDEYDGGKVEANQQINWNSHFHSHTVTTGRRTVALHYSGTNRKINHYENGSLVATFDIAGAPLWGTDVNLRAGVGNGANTRVYSELVFFNEGAAFTQAEIDQIVSDPYSAFETYEDELEEYGLQLNTGSEQVSIPFTGAYSGNKILTDGTSVAVSGSGTHLEDGTTPQQISEIRATDSNSTHVFSFDQTTGTTVKSATSSLVATLVGMTNANWQPVLQKFTFNVPIDYPSAHAAVSAEKDKGDNILNEIIIDGRDTVKCNVVTDPSITRMIIRGKTQWTDPTKPPNDGITPATGEAAAFGGFYAGNSASREVGYPIVLKDLFLESTNTNAIITQYWRAVANVEFERCDISSPNASGFRHNTNASDGKCKVVFKQTRFETAAMNVSGGSRVLDLTIIDCYSPKTGYATSSYTDAINAANPNNKININGYIVNYVTAMSGFREVIEVQGDTSISNLISNVAVGARLIKHSAGNYFEESITGGVDMTGWFGAGGELTADARTAIGTGTGFNGTTIMEWADAPITNDSTATLTIPLPAFTAAMTATYTAPVVPTYNASATFGLPAYESNGTVTTTIPVSSATINVPLPSYSGAVTVTTGIPSYSAAMIAELPAFTGSGNATSTVPVSNAVITVTLPAFEADITSVTGTPESNANITVALPAYMADAVAGTTRPESSASITVSLPSYSASVAAVTGTPSYSASINAALPTYTANSSVTTTVPESNATISIVMPSFAASATASYGVQQFNALLTVNLPPFVGASAVTTTVPEFNSAINIKLPSFKATMNGRSKEYEVISNLINIISNANTIKIKD